MVGIKGIIIEEEQNDEKILNKVKNRKADVGIYGCGNIGVMVYEYLKVNKVRVDFFVVDDEYYFLDKYEEIPIRRLSSLKQVKDHLDIFIGFADFNKALKKIERLGDNIDAYCISNPCIYLRGYSLDSEFYYENKKEFEYAYSFFEDELSKKIFIAYLNTRINDNYKYMLPFGSGKTYFNNEVFTISNEEIYVDCGAYNGDSIKKFLDSVKMNYKWIYAIEPDKINFEEMRRYVEDNRIENITLINNGIWKEKDRLGFSDTGGQEGSLIDPNRDTDYFIEVDALDNILCNEKVTFMKLSVQGAEENALIGAQNILKRDEPKLVITVFMRQDSLIKIPSIIKKINPKYKLYLRCEEPFFAKVILYAKVDK